MKIERLLLGLFASFLMVGCSQNDDLPNANEEANGKDSYISVKICSPKDFGSRATDENDFADAVGNEGTVKKAHFFFFNDNGQPVAVNDGKNYKAMDLSQDDDTDENGNTESEIEAVVVLEKTEVTPSKMVVVLNWDYADAALTLTNLVDQVVLEAKALDATNGFMMSNSVYYEGGIINATAVTAEHFRSSSDLALQNPVTAYVERLAVKVTSSLNTDNNTYYDSTLKGFDTGVSYKDANNNDVKIYAQVLGWQLNTTNPKSYLVKKLDANWGTTSPFTDWNEPGKFRSYWGISHATSATEFEDSKKFKWESIPSEMTGIEYCLENTTSTTTKAVFKAQLCTVDNNALKPVTIWQWYAKYYLTESDVLKDVLVQVNSEIDKLSTDAQYDLKVGDIVVDYATASTDPKDFYKVNFKLSTTKADASVAGGKKYSEILSSVIPAKKWQDGATYYFTSIEHLNQEKAVIRNHAYQLLVTQVVGLGTPANKPDPDPNTPDPEPEIPEPVDPSDTETYIAAKINVLSWRLVNNSVILGKQ